MKVLVLLKEATIQSISVDILMYVSVNLGRFLHAESLKPILKESVGVNQKDEFLVLSSTNRQCDSKQ